MRWIVHAHGGPSDHCIDPDRGTAFDLRAGSFGVAGDGGGSGFPSFLKISIHSSTIWQSSSKTAPLVRTVATTEEQVRRCTYKTLVLFGPLHDLPVPRAVLHRLIPFKAAATRRT